MAITREQALTLDTFHRPGQFVPDRDRCYVWRRNGRTQTWATRPTHYRVPIQYGARLPSDFHGYIEAPEMTARHGTNVMSGDSVFAPADCPCCHGTKS